MKKKGHTPANPAHWWVCEGYGEAVPAVCKICGARTVFHPLEKFREFGTEPLTPTQPASIVRGRMR